MPSIQQLRRMAEAYMATQDLGIPMLRGETTGDLDQKWMQAWIRYRCEEDREVLRTLMREMPPPPDLSGLDQFAPDLGGLDDLSQSLNQLTNPEPRSVKARRTRWPGGKANRRQRDE